MVVTEEMQNIINALIEELPIEKIYLFGSHAYGTPTDDSDYDFYVLIPNGGIKPIDAKINARRSLSRIKRKKNTDILADYKDRFEERSKYNTLEKKVAMEGVLLYERS
jgi:predicted nucleotidyltransferase